MNKSEAGKLGQHKTTQVLRERRYEKVRLYNENPSTCNLCSKSLPYDKRKNKFCSHSCAARQNNSRRRLVKQCENCGVDIESRNQRFCSNQCQSDLQWVNAKILMEKGEIPYNRRYVYEAQGHVCSVCQLVTWMDQPIPLELDHIDGNSTNNSITNLRMICSNCHAQTPTYKSKNLGNGRHYRRQRYNEGKSY